MSVLLVKLRGVPDDEAEELRELLTTNQIDHYETRAGNWGISMPAIWLKDSNQLQEARSLVEEYQAERFAKARDECEQLKKEGQNRSFIDEVRENPVRILAYLAAIAVVVYLSTKPFMDIGK